jgi:class 3 adenylate cyclase
VRERPSGTVTFLFTDIEDSTRRWETDPDVMRGALAAHDEVVRTAIEGHDGWFFKHTGGGVCAAFSSAPDALAAAVEAQRRLGLPVRMAVVTGSAEQRADDYFGPALNRAARVMAAAHVCSDLNEYNVLDALDSPVHKSLLTVELLHGHARYAMLETIRQFAGEQLADPVAGVRDRHARYYADQAVAHWDLWDGPRIRVALDWHTAASLCVNIGQPEDAVAYARQQIRLALEQSAGPM